MMSKALLAIVCIVAGAGGTYLVVRATAPSAPPATVATTPEPTPTATVEQSEGVVGEAAPPATPPVQAEAVPAPARPAASASRPATPARRTEAPAKAPQTAPPAREEPPVAIAPAPISDNQASRSVEPQAA